MRIQDPKGINLNNPLLLSESKIISHVACLIKLWERVKLHMMSSFFFSNNLSTLPNDKIVGRSNLEAFAEDFKLRHKLFSVMIGWNKLKKERGKLLLNSIFFFSLNQPRFPNPSNVPRFSDILGLLIENRR